MIRRTLALGLFGSSLVGIALVLSPPSWASGQAGAGAAQNREGSDEEPGKRIDKAIETYENRADQDLDHTRKEIERLRKEVAELTELQLNMAVALAELQAEIRVRSLMDSEGNNASTAPSGSEEATKLEQQRQRIRNVELNRELRQVQEFLRNVVQQKRSEADQLVGQLRNLRAQQRQLASEAEQRGKQTPPKSQD